MATTLDNINLPSNPDLGAAEVGKDFLLFVNTGTVSTPEWQMIGGQRNSGLTRQAETIDVSHKTSGGWSATKAGLRSWSIDLSGLVLLQDIGVHALAKAFEEGKDVFLKLAPQHTLLSTEVVADGEVQYRLRRKYALGKRSTATVDTVFYAADRRVDFEMTLDWAEHHALLKAGFDLNLRSAFVKNEIQFGHIDRPTTRNNSLEDTKFEVCNHKWSDLSEARYGVALLNDCTYGLSAEGSDLRLTLHKSGCRPDPFSDQGHHTMTYSLLPHMGGFSAESVIRPAYELNYAPVVTDGEAVVPKLFSLSHPGIICEAVKPAEDDDTAAVLRLYESERNHSCCKVMLYGAKRVFLTNLLEEKEEELTIAQDGSVTLRFDPFEIKTLLIER